VWSLLSFWTIVIIYYIIYRIDHPDGNHGIRTEPFIILIVVWLETIIMISNDDSDDEITECASFVFVKNNLFLTLLSWKPKEMSCKCWHCVDYWYVLLCEITKCASFVFVMTTIHTHTPFCRGSQRRCAVNVDIVLSIGMYSNVDIVLSIDMYCCVCYVFMCPLSSLSIRNNNTRDRSFRVHFPCAEARQGFLEGF